MQEVIEVEMEFCPICKKQIEFVYTECPSGHKVCTSCGYRTTKSKMKLVINNHGYTFKEEQI